MGYIRLDRKILEWEWYSDINTKTIFIHCLLKANWKDAKFCGRVIERGSFVTSLPTLAHESGLSVRSVRTALEHLKSTGEVTVKSTNKYSVVTVVNYDYYQADDTQTDSQPTVNRQASDRQPTLIEKDKKEEKNKKDKKGNTVKKEPKHNYGEYQHVKLTDNEYSRLVDDYGEPALLSGIKNVDEYCQGHGKKYSDYNLVLRKWGIKSPKLSDIKPVKPFEPEQIDDEDSEWANLSDDEWEAKMRALDFEEEFNNHIEEGD